MRYKNKSALVKCDICGKEFYPRGIKSHLRLNHYLEITKVTTQVTTQVKPVEAAKLLKSGGEVTQVTTQVTKRVYSPSEKYRMERLETHIDQAIKAYQYGLDCLDYMNQRGKDDVYPMSKKDFDEYVGQIKASYLGIWPDIQVRLREKGLLK